MAIDMRKQTAFTKRYRKKGRGNKPKKKFQLVGTRNRLTGIGRFSSMNIFPERLKCRLKWNKAYTIAAGTSDVATVSSFKLTEMYDPEVAASSSLQPYGYDNLMAHYTHYKVLSATVKVHFTHLSGNPMIVGVIQSLDTVTTSYDTVDEFINDPRATYKVTHNYLPKATVSTKYTAKKTYAGFNNHSLKGAVSSSVTEGYYAVVYSNNAGPGNSQAALDYWVEIDYYAEFVEQANVAKS